MTRNKADYTPMMQQYLDIKEDYKDAIVFFRLGDFYEMFFEDAILASRELEIQLTARDAGGKERIPMCGVPHHAVEGYLNRLIDKGYKVAICEQTETPTPGKKLVKREVVRLVTPGTNIDDSRATDHYIAAVGFGEYFYSLAYLCMTTGELYSLKLPSDTSALINELGALPIKEIVFSHALDSEYLKRYTEHENITVSIHSNTDIDAVFDHIHQPLQTPIEQKNVKRLLSYIMKTQKRHLMHIKPTQTVEPASTMKMDASTLRSLEIFKTIRQNHENGSLFWLINKTHTAMGARYLKKQLLKPLLDSIELNKRYDLVATMNKEFIIVDELKDALKRVYDLERIIGKVAYGNTNAKDLVQLRHSLHALPPLKTGLKSLSAPKAQELYERLDELKSLRELLDRALKDEVPLSIREGNMIREGYDEALDEMRSVHLDVKTYLEELEASERKKTGIKKLKIGYNRVFGYYIEIPKGQVANLKDDLGYSRKQTLANAERYINETLKEKERIILSSEEKSVALEYDLFIKLQQTVRKHTRAIQQNAEIISELDMHIAFSTISELYRLTRPNLHDEAIINIKNSTHPVVMKVLEDVFVPNDIILDETTDIALITGPNMGGKSTYMRQLAITAILAQIGSFVPAESAEMPVFDKLFTRIGSSDDMMSGQSTFMVEMLDANHAIQNATAKSLILFDEIGRGTSTYDGLALAQAIIEYIHHNIGCKTLFATHYHELTELENSLSKMKNIHVAAEEKDGNIVFLYQVKKGRADKSYGINVASLAKLPKVLIRRSEKILKLLEAQGSAFETNLFTLNDLTEVEEAPNPNQRVLDQIKDIDLDHMTPMDALNVLYELRKKLKS